VSRAPTVCNTWGARRTRRGTGSATGAGGRRRRRGHANPDYSTDKWKRVRGRYKRLHPIYETHGCGRESQEVHHIDAGTSHNWDDTSKRCASPVTGRLTSSRTLRGTGCGRTTDRSPLEVRVAGCRSEAAWVSTGRLLAEPCIHTACRARPVTKVHRDRSRARVHQPESDARR
jgi:hypothetical protein